MPRKAKKYLFDLLTAIQAIEEVHLAGINNQEEFEGNKTVIRAVERELEIIGEAAYRLHQMGISLSQADSLINRRNTIIHQYDSYQPRTIWNVAVRHLIKLKTEVVELLGEE